MENQPTESKKSWSQATREAIKALIPFIVSLITQNVGGVKGWLLGFILRYGGRSAFDSISEAIRKHDRAQEQAKAEAEKNKVVENPNSTVDEVGKAYEDQFNSGRH